MSLYPDLDDVAAESPVATKELAELRSRVKELEKERDEAIAAIVQWEKATTLTDWSGSYAALKRIAARAAGEEK